MNTDRSEIANPGHPDFTATITSDDGIVTPIRISDLSRRGADLRLDTPPQTGSEVLLTLMHRENRLRFRARMKWGGEIDGGYAAGLEFLAPLEPNFLADLSRSRSLEPTAARRAGHLPAVVRTQGSAEQTFAAHIIDYSHSGLCLASPQQFDPGEVLLIEVADGHRPRTTILARIVWERPEGANALHGCAFADEKAATHLDKAAQRLRKRTRRTVQTAHEPPGEHHSHSRNTATNATTAEDESWGSWP